MTNNSSPCVSVLIPTLNEEENIQQAIESVESQSLRDFEILVCDGGSTDATVDVVQSQESSNIKLLTDSGGLMSQYNTLCNAADGRYLAILDADSVMLPKKLEKQVHLLEDNPNIGAVGTGLQFRDQDGNVVRELDTPTGCEIKWTAIRTNPIHHTTVLFRAKAVKTADGYQDRPFGDYDLIIRLAKNWNLSNIDEVLTQTLERQSRGGRNFSPIRSLYHNSIIGFYALLIMDWKATEFPTAIMQRMGTSVRLMYSCLPKNK